MSWMGGSRNYDVSSGCSSWSKLEYLPWQINLIVERRRFTQRFSVSLNASLFLWKLSLNGYVAVEGVPDYRSTNDIYILKRRAAEPKTISERHEGEVHRLLQRVV